MTVIEQLRRRFPGEWRYDARSGSWRGPGGAEVRRVGYPLDRWDGDEACETRLVLYRPGAEGEVIGGDCIWGGDRRLVVWGAQ